MPIQVTAAAKIAVGISTLSTSLSCPTWTNALFFSGFMRSAVTTFTTAETQIRRPM